MESDKFPKLTREQLRQLKDEWDRVDGIIPYEEREPTIVGWVALAIVCTLSLGIGIVLGVVIMKMIGA